MLAARNCFLGGATQLVERTFVEINLKEKLNECRRNNKQSTHI
jgi:hypothetical protein